MCCAGIGKTTLANEICLRWARDGFLSENFDAVVLIPMRCVQQRSLEEVMIQNIEDDTYQQLKKSAGNRCLIILEGLDEMAPDRQNSDSFFIGLIKDCTILEKSTILVTSRPHACDKLNDDRRVEIIGFGADEIKEFVEKSFPDDEQSRVSELLHQLNDYPHLKSLCYIPLNLVMITDIFRCSQNKKLPSTLTELYKLFLVMILERHTKKENKKCMSLSASLTAANSESLKKMLPGIPINAIGTVFLLCKLSFCGFFDWYTDMQEEDKFGDEKKWKDPKIIFTMEDLIQCGIEVTTSQFDGVGLLKVTHIHELPKDTSSYSFSHLSIQEFLSSLYISLLLPRQEQLRLMNKHFHDFPNVFIFLCGLARLECDEMYQIIYSKLTSKNDSNFHSNPDVVPAVRCMYESKCASRSTKPFTLDMRWNYLHLYDSFCASHVVSNYPVSQLIMESCHVGDTGAEVLAKHCCNGETTGQLLELIDLTGNDLTVNGMVHVMKIVRASESYYTTAATMQLFVMCAVTTGGTALKHLNVSGNDIGDDGISVITKTPEYNDTLTKLNVSRCKVSVKGMYSSYYSAIACKCR